MKAVILAAGKGTRMGDLTDEMPKPMLRVHDRPVLEHIITGLREVGIQEFCIITGWQAEVIESHFRDGADLRVSISYTRQEVQDGTGKAPELAKEFVGEEAFLLTYGDILVKPETYQQMYDRSVQDPEGFWAEIAEELHWFKKWDKVLEWDAPYAKWFLGGQINVSSIVSFVPPSGV